MEMRIGGTDSPVIRHPHTLEPYIPGSSLKGKVRSLLEMASGLVPFSIDNGGIVSWKTVEKLKQGKPELVEEAKDILKIFGSSGADSIEDMDIGPTRVAFSDVILMKNGRKKRRQIAGSLLK